MPVFNKMVYNGTEYILGGGGNIGEPLNLTVTTSGLDATITWEDNEIGTIPPTTFQKSELVRKIGSAPTSPSDGVLVVTETVKDTYKVSGYVDSGLTDGETYYYRVFSYSDLGGISYCDAESVTPSAGGWQPGVNTLVYLSLDGDTNDSSGNGHNGSTPASTYSWEYILGNSGAKCCKITGDGTGDDGATISGTYGTALGSGDRTLSIWMKIISGINSTQVSPVILGNIAGGTSGCWFGLWCMDASATRIGILRYMNEPETNSFSYDNNWHNYTLTYSDTNKAKLYLDGTQITMTSNPNSSFNTLTNDFYIGINRASNSGKVICFADYILENKERTAQDISDYFNQTKADYGIS